MHTRPAIQTNSNSCYIQIGQTRTADNLKLSGEMYKILWFYETGFQEEKIPKIKEFIHIFGRTDKQQLLGGLAK